MSDPRATPDLRIAEIAAHQHGVISIAQIRAAGLDKHQVLHRVRTARLHRIHQGVFAVGHSHLAIPGDGGRRRRAGIRLHRCPSLLPEHVTRRRGIPVTTPSRTISDLRGAVSPPELRRAQRQAEVLGLSLESSASHDGTRSELEFLFLDLCRKHRLPAPEVNIRIGSLLVDFVWRKQRLVVETDGYRYHRGRVAFENDRVRDLKLRALGYDVIRLTHHQVVSSSNEVFAILREALGR